MQPTIGDIIGARRRELAMTQETLAEAASVSVETVRKLEQNERTTARMSTLNKLAGALRVTTSSLLGDASRATARREADHDQMALVGIRKVLTPVRGSVVHSGSTVTTATVGTALRDVDRAYHSDDYSLALSRLPGMLVAARSAADAADGTTRRDALRRLAQAHELAGTVLVQVRAFDLAHRTLSLGLDAAAEADDELLDASNTVTMCWLLLREGRFEEAEALAVSTADAIEPRFSVSDPERLAIWGVLMLRAAAAAVRDTRWDTADDMLTAAAAAATRIGEQIPAGVLDRHPATVGTFGVDLVAMKRTEALVIAGDPGAALEVARQMRQANPARPMLNNGNRHRLGVAQAQAMQGSYSDATETLFALRDGNATWLRQQRLARDVVYLVASARRRMMTQELADLAALVGAEV